MENVREQDPTAIVAHAAPERAYRHGGC